MIYTIPKQLKEEYKIWDRPRIWWKDVVTCAVLLGVFLVLKSFVHRWLMIPYWITAIVSCFYLIRPAHANPTKRNWEAILFLIGKDHTVYYSLNHVQKGDDKAC